MEFPAGAATSDLSAVYIPLRPRLADAGVSALQKALIHDSVVRAPVKLQRTRHTDEILRGGEMKDDGASLTQ